MAIENLVHQLGTDKVVHIRYGVWSSDPYYQNNPENVSRSSYYGIGTSTPQAMVDGLFNSLGSAQIPANVPGQVNTRLGVSSPYQIKIAGNLGAGSVEVQVKATGAPPAGNNMLRVAVVERAYDWPSAPGSNGQTHFEGALLDFVPDPNGTPLTIAAGDSQTFSFNYNLQQVNFHASLELTVVAFIQNDGSKEVLQAGYFNGKIHLDAIKGSALLASGQTGVLTGAISNDFSSTATVNFRIKGAVPAGWNVSVTSPQGAIPLNSLTQISVAGGDSLPFEVQIDPQGNPGGLRLQGKIMSPADSTASQVVNFNAVTKEVDVLLVDNDGGENYENYYLDALSQTSYSYGSLPVSSGDLSAGDLAGIPVVIWMTGLNEPGITPADMDALSGYLDSGGNLFLSGFDLAYNLGDSLSSHYSAQTEAFLHHYLHANYLKKSIFILNLDGVSGDPIGDGISQMKLFGGTGAGNMGYIGGNFVYPNEIAPADTDAHSVFTFFSQPSRTAAIRARHGNGRVLFMPFCYEAIADQNYRYLVMSRAVDWLKAPTGVTAGEPPLSRSFILYPNYPNPFNPVTHIRYQLAAGNSGTVSLNIYDLTGQKVKTLIRAKQAPGVYTVLWDGRDNAGNQVASGVYFYRLKTATETLTRKMILMR